MKSAYNHQWVYNLALIKETKRWSNHGFITSVQFSAIAEAFKTPFYHPNLIIRILLFVATLLAISGVTGLLALMFADSGAIVISIGCIVYGLASLAVLEKLFIGNNHFKSGVTEALLYHACGFIIGGAGGLSEFDNTQLILITSLIVFTFAGWRYLDLLCTIAAFLSLAGILFYNLYEAGGMVQQLIPFVFLLVFGFVYVGFKKLKSLVNLKLWSYNLLVVESLSLILIYASGNYLVVRELSVNLMELSIEPGQDIPFAFVFYVLTVAIPFAYLYFGIKNRDVVLLRVSLLVLAFSAFTFKYYYSLGHTEITLIVAGAMLCILAIALMRYLKTIKHGFTREDVMSHKWQGMNVEALLISQTMGGNQMGNASSGETGGGGSSGGGGASSDF